MQSSEEIGTALEPINPDPPLGRRLFLEKSAGYTTSQLAITYGLEETMVEELIRIEIDEGHLRLIRQEVRDHLVLKSFEIDQELKAMYTRLPDMGQKRSQTAMKDADGDVVAVDLIEDWSNVPAKVNILKERRMLIPVQNNLLKSDTDDRGGGERDSDFKTLMSTIQNITTTVIGDANRRLAIEARQAGRIEGAQAIPAEATVVEEGAIDGSDE
jgi:hypothetical protein